LLGFYLKFLGSEASKFGSFASKKLQIKNFAGLRANFSAGEKFASFEN